MEKTNKLYRQDMYLKECPCTVLSLIGEPGSQYAILDQTPFFPEGGGQPSDLGFFISSRTGHPLASVSHVYEAEGVVYHQFEPLEDFQLSAGDTVICRLDWERRFLNMQRHCGEHILSAAFFELFRGINRGFRMGDDYMTIDISLEEGSLIPEFTDEAICEAEILANKMIWDNLPITIRHFETREEAAKCPMRKPLAIEEDITLVCVGDEENPAGCVACCGTHPEKSGAVGLIKIYRYESYKGMTRITFDAGKPALLRFQECEAVLKNLCRRYSADNATLIEKISIAEEKNKGIRQELHNLKKTYLEEQANEIRIALKDGAKVLLREYPVLRIDDLTTLGRLLGEETKGLLLFVSPTENTLYLQSNGSPDCGKIVGDNAGVWRGKGGGKKDNARALFPARQDLDCFIDYLFKSQR